MLFKYYFCYNSLLLLAKATIIIFIFHFIDLNTWTAKVFFVSVPLLSFMIIFNFFLIRVIIAIVFLYCIYFGSESILVHVTPLHALCKTVWVLIYEKTWWPGRTGRKKEEKRRSERMWNAVIFMLRLFRVCLSSWWGLYLSVKAEGVKWSSSVWQN